MDSVKSHGENQGKKTVRGSRGGVSVITHWVVKYTSWKR